MAFLALVLAAAPCYSTPVLQTANSSIRGQVLFPDGAPGRAWIQPAE